ncbi:MAG TPA: amino acid adenylation domain-containing protein, partial [Herpetosiphonaceae bacterium]
MRATDAGLSASGLRSALQAVLPEYLVPSAVVLLDALPLTPHGKVDRQALPAPESAHAGQADAYVAPRTASETLLAGIWAAVLHREQVSVDATFFDLGGHSLLATQVIARVRETFQVELPLRTLFEAPTVAGLAARIEQAQGTFAPPIRPAPRDGALPLSFAQQRIWFLDQLQPGSATYNIPAALRLGGTLDVAALVEGLSMIVARHEALRTTFATTDEGRPVQIIGPAQAVALPLLDLQKLTEVAQDTEVRRLIHEEAQRPFDLHHGPLLRATLLRLADTDHVLLLTMHHIVADGWSWGVFFHELSALYAATVSSTIPALPALPIQYADYAVWQRDWLQGDVLDSQLGYWQQQLAGLTTLQLPTDYPRPPISTLRGTIFTFTLPKAINDGLVVLSRREGVTLFMTLLTAFQTLLHRYSRQDDIVVGTPIANRTRAETEDLIGCFINMLALRADLSGRPTFREALRRVRELTLSAYAHQDLSFEQVVDALQPERDLSRHPLFQVMFALQSATHAPPELSGLTLEQLPIDLESVKFDLNLTLAETDAGLAGVLEYSTDLFSAETMARLVGHYETLLHAIVSDPDQRLVDLPLLTASEREQIVVAWNATAVSYPTEPCLHELIVAQVARTPDAAAVVFEDQQLSYAELNARANQLAHALQARGVGPEVRVGVCLDRSLDLVIALVAILKAGGAYVPLDPSYPADRLQFMVGDAQVLVLLTTSVFAERVDAAGTQLLCLDTAWPEIAREPTDELATGVAANNLAYMIYTSGSTGRPKGALKTHRAIVNRLLWMQDAYQITPADRVLQKTPFSFDVSVWEFFWPLMTGAALVVARPEGHKDPTYLVEVIRRHAITTLHFVPSMLQVFLDAEDVQMCRSLRQVICSGEALPAALRDRFFTRLDAELHNLYGPTEAAVDVSYWPCKRERALVPIGYPIANTQLYVLDAQLQPVPVGVPGELHIGGVQLARGYHNRPALTAEKFIPDPFSAKPNARLYKTGDLARYLPDGAIDYLGRIDYQVKLRGFRIELGEIEAVVSQHPGVREVVVVVREQRLVAYVVPSVDRSAPTDTTDTDHDPSPGLTEAFVADLQAFVKQHLPDYMVPGVVVPLPALPLSPNGKVDRRALPAPTHLRPELEAGFAAPETPVETRLAQIWAEVLRLPQVGIHNNFFALGGDSILSIQIVARARQVGVQLTPRQIFQYQTIAELATVAGTTTTVTAEQGLVTGSVPLTPIQHWFFGREHPEPHHWNQARLLEVGQPLD